MQLAKLPNDIHIPDRRGWECISALIVGTDCPEPVCAGYAEAFKVLCDASGIPCISVVGDAKSDAADEAGRHQWNYVWFNDAWYAVDVTWNDPVIQGNFQLCSGKESKKWLLLGADTMVSDITFIESHRETGISSNMFFSPASMLSSHAYQIDITPKLEITSTRVTDIYTSDYKSYGERVTAEVSVNTGDEYFSVYDEDIVSFYLGEKKLENTDVYLMGESVANGYVKNYVIAYSTEYQEIPVGEHILTIRFEGNETERVRLLPAEQSFSVVINPIIPIETEEMTPIISTENDLTDNIDEVDLEDVNDKMDFKSIGDRVINILEIFINWFVLFIEFIKNIFRK